MRTFPLVNSVTFISRSGNRTPHKMGSLTGYYYKMSHKIVQIALEKPITDIGQLSKEEKRLLNNYVRNGTLVKGKGVLSPILKMVYAAQGYNFQEERNRLVREVLAPFAVMETKENLWKGRIEETSLEPGVYYIEVSWYDIEENSGYVPVIQYNS
jgi:hypothetical protein